MEVRYQLYTPAALPLVKEVTLTHGIGDWMCPVGGLDMLGNSFS